MDTFPPLTCDWDGEVFRPIHPRRADNYLTVGERYSIVQYEDRSAATHNHQFAWLYDAWMNLPEDIADQYPTPEHLRKRALIDAGFYDETIIDAGTNAAAIRVAAAVQAIDTFALVFVRKCFVIRRTAKSQSRRAMKKDEFQASKTAIMEVIDELVQRREAA
ncbi:hypothetical protein [Afipia carboxidovorans]|uniref:hypothetical protein n=1 Tax=Afipia carboxidovorans TaxID=40137 RepID=UPI00308BB36A|nr:hypothetical protein CRBSH125_35090 [Afipia carboxidovorans]